MKGIYFKKHRRSGRGGCSDSIALSVGTDKVMQETGIFPGAGKVMSDGLFALATAYRTAYGFSALTLQRRLAPNRPMLHALIFGALGLVATIGGAGGNVE